MIDIKVPAVGESITEVTLVKWLKQDGDWVDRDEMIAELVDMSKRMADQAATHSAYRRRPWWQRLAGYVRVSS